MLQRLYDIKMTEEMVTQLPEANRLFPWYTFYHRFPFMVILDLVKTTRSGVHGLLLVGHNPSLQVFADLMTASGHGDARQRLREKFPTAALAVIDFPIDQWDRLHPHSGRLDRLITPGLLDAAPD